MARRVCAMLLAAAGMLPAAARAGAPVRVPGEGLPQAVASLGALDGVGALAVGDDGATAAAAFASDKAGRSVVRVARAGPAPPAEFPVRGVVRALRFDRAGSALLIVAAREPKRSPGQTFLLRVDAATLEASREIVLPRGARDADVLGASELLVAGDDELRTFRLPELTSGRLYRLDGANRAVAAIPGARRVLVGRGDGIVLVDLDDAQGRDGIPVRARLATAAPVAAIAIDPEGGEALARLDDGRVVRFRVDPLGEPVEDGTATFVAWPGDRPPAPAPRAKAPEPEPPPAPEPEPPPLPKPRPPPAPKPEPPKPEPPPAPKPKPPEPQPPPAPEPEPPPAPAPEPPVPEPPAPSPPPPPPEPVVPPPAPVIREVPPVAPARSEGATLHGRVTGAAAAEVVAVVAFGPDNLLREAARVRTGEGGAWSVSGLAPGVYRIVLDAGGGKALETQPAFRSVRVEPGATVDVAPIEARRAF